MKIEIDIPDEELVAMIKEKLTERIAQNMYHGWHEGYAYRKEISKVVREVIREDIDNLSKRAVDAASKSIENRALKKFADSILEKVDAEDEL